MDAEQQFQAAAQLYQSGDFPGAEARLEELAEAVPGNPNILHLLSLARLRQDKSAAATDSLKQLTDLAPGSAEAHDLYGCALRQSGRINAAIRHFQRALEIEPDAAHVHYNLGNAYRDDRQVSQAAAHYKRATELDPDNLNAHFNLGQAYFNQREMVKASAAFEYVVQRAPQDLEALTLLARTALQAKQFMLSRKACEDALRLAPDNTDLRLLHAQVTAQLGDLESAVESYAQLLKTHPDNTELLCAQGAVLRAQGDAEGALKNYLKAVDIEPDSPDHRAKLGRLLEGMNRLDDAWKAITPALDADPGHPAVNLVAARLERRTGDHEKALARLNGLDAGTLAASAAQGEIHFERGFLYDQQGRPGDAIENFEHGNAFLAQDKQSAEIFRTQSEEYLKRLRQAFDSPGAKPASKSTDQNAGAEPTFLVGFPWTGTTFLDRVMDAHPAIQVLEKSETLSAVRNHLLAQSAAFPADLFDVPDGVLEEMRQAYFHAVDQAITRDSSALLVDKLPLNILNAGLLHRLFPNAKFILALRHPCDVCLSSFMQPFDLNSGTVHFTRLEDTVRFYEDVMGLWQTQCETLNLKVHQIRDEDLAAGFAPAARGLLEFLGVSWKGPLPASDFTKAQDTGADVLGRWRTYELHMAPYLSRLRPFIERFGYDTGDR
ncbi:MAG: tetratricopeptide repeat protein [Rhodospirillales bacterium]